MRVTPEVDSEMIDGVVSSWGEMQDASSRLLSKMAPELEIAQTLPESVFAPFAALTGKLRRARNDVPAPAAPPIPAEHLTAADEFSMKYQKARDSLLDRLS